MASRVAEMRLLNRKRWDAHVAAREAQGIPLEPTGGALFNRSNPLGPNGNFQNPYVRTNDPDKRYVEKRGKLVFVDKLGRPQQGPKTEEERIELMRNWQDNQRNSKSYVPVYGYDFTSVNVASHRKYRIPNTSVVNKVGDLRLICCCNMRLTAVRNAPANSFFVVSSAHLFVFEFRRNGSGGSTCSASSCTRPWCLSRSTSPTGAGIAACGETPTMSWSRSTA